jgi:transcriptional regulator with XRE-family HTH domain
MTLGERLAAARKAAKMTQDQLATALDCGQSSISAWETEANPLTVPMLRRILDAIGVPDEERIEMVAACVRAQPVDDATI